MLKIQYSSTLLRKFLSDAQVLRPFGAVFQAVFDWAIRILKLQITVDCIFALFESSLSFGCPIDAPIRERMNPCCRFLQATVSGQNGIWRETRSKRAHAFALLIGQEFPVHGKNFWLYVISLTAKLTFHKGVSYRKQLRASNSVIADWQVIRGLRFIMARFNPGF